MATNLNITDLLVVIKRLYLRVVTIQNHSRATFAHNAGNTASSHNITQPLSECIDKLAASAVSRPSDPVKSITTEPAISSHNYSTITRDPDSMTEPGELSIHMKDAHKYSGVSQDTGVRLVQTTWEHFHTTIRLARQGNTQDAKIHMDLTNNALKEAAHYLPEQVYTRFSQEVMEAIEEISKQV